MSNKHAPQSTENSASLLVQARAKAGITQRELAARAHTSQSVVARIERGQTIPSVETLDRLLAAAGFELVECRREMLEVLVVACGRDVRVRGESREPLHARAEGADQDISHAVRGENGDEALGIERPDSARALRHVAHPR